MSIQQIAAGEAFPADYTGEFPHIIICKYRSAAALFLIPETIGLWPDADQEASQDVRFAW